MLISPWFKHSYIAPITAADIITDMPIGDTIELIAVEANRSNVSPFMFAL